MTLQARLLTGVALFTIVLGGCAAESDEPSDDLGGELDDSADTIENEYLLVYRDQQEHCFEPNLNGFHQFRIARNLNASGPVAPERGDQIKITISPETEEVFYLRFHPHGADDEADIWVELRDWDQRPDSTGSSRTTQVYFKEGGFYDVTVTTENNYVRVEHDRVPNSSGCYEIESHSDTEPVEEDRVVLQGAQREAQ